jgi:hypothetical protein
MTTIHPDLATILAWHDALNASDLERFAALLHDDVEFVGPRGSGHGAALVRDWAGRAGIQLQPERWYQRNDDVVVTQQARWRDPDTGDLGDPIAAATAFHVRDGQVHRIARFDTLQQALDTAGLDASAEVAAP